jgi:DNA-binding MarR family transcriptional regulator
MAPALGLLEAYLNPADARSHVIHLSARGREVRDRIDAIIRRGETIQPDQAFRAA